MKRIRLERWAHQNQAPRNPRLYLFGEQRSPFSQSSRPTVRKEQQRRHYQVQHQWHQQRRTAASRRKASSAAAAQVDTLEPEANTITGELEGSRDEEGLERPRTPLNAPSHRKASQSAKLSALHARLSLSSKLPLQTLARCLIDPSVDPRQGYNNAPFAILGQDLLGYYTSEWLLCHYPRLPMPVLFAAQYAYVGSQTLAAIRGEWGVEVVAAPGQEVDPGLLQLKRMIPGNAMIEGENRRVKEMPQVRRLGSGRRNEEQNWRRGMSSRIVYDDQFGDLQTGLPPVDAQPHPGAAISERAERDGDARVESFTPNQPHTQASHQPPRPQTRADADPTTVELASASFIRALAGAIYLHAGSAASKQFHQDHILSRNLQLHTLFHFTHPTRDLSILCKREDFEPPVARLISETGRLSRTPVFVVGVYSGNDKLGEAAGSSLNEGRVRAAAAALRSWYLYSPPDSEIVRPSDVEGVGSEWKKMWRAQMVDPGEIIT